MRWPFRKTYVQQAISIQTGNNNLWFGYEAPFVPYAHFLKKRDKKNAEAKAFLDEALKHYEAALEMKPNDATMLLFGNCFSAVLSATLSADQLTNRGMHNSKICV